MKLDEFRFEKANTGSRPLMLFPRQIVPTAARDDSEIPMMI